MAHNKIIIVTIHQPSSKLFQMFHKAILLDKGGRLVFFGTPSDMLRYFAEAEHQHQFGAELGACPSCGTTRPEFIFDVLETPLRDLSGDIIYEENNRGQLVAARRYSPEFWRDKYEAFRLIQDVKQVSLRKESGTAVAGRAGRKEEAVLRFAGTTNGRSSARCCGVPSSASCAIERTSLSRFVSRRFWRCSSPRYLRYSDSGHYDFASAYHIPTFLVSEFDRGHVPRADQQRRRHHSRSGRSCSGSAI